MKPISLVTVAYNAAATIEDTILSALAQQGADFEHVLIDGGSTDRTMDIVERYRGHFSRIVSEPDKGIYDAMNKGLALAQGEFIGFLNSDDYFASERALASVQAALTANDLGAVWGDVVQVDSRGIPKRMISGAWFRPTRFKLGLMPPHPAFYARTAALRAVGGFNPTYRIGGDFDLLLRLFADPTVQSLYIKELITVMRIGGVSTDGPGATTRVSAEILQSLRSNGIQVPAQLINIRYCLRLLEVAKGTGLAIAGHRYAAHWPVPA